MAILYQKPVKMSSGRVTQYQAGEHQITTETRKDGNTEKSLALTND